MLFCVWTYIRPWIRPWIDGADGDDDILSAQGASWKWSLEKWMRYNRVTYTVANNGISIHRHTLNMRHPWPSHLRKTSDGCNRTHNIHPYSLPRPCVRRRCEKPSIRRTYWLHSRKSQRLCRRQRTDCETRWASCKWFLWFGSCSGEDQEPWTAGA